MEERMEMPFGKKIQIGNFTVLKYTKTLSKRDLAHLREDIPIDIRKHLQRGGIPYIKVEAISGLWAIEFSIGSKVYGMINALVMGADDKEKTTLAHIFNMWFIDTTVPGDSEFQEDKARAMKAFMDRCKAKKISDEEDQKILDELKSQEEAKAAILEMSEEAKKEAEDGEGK